MTAKASLGRKFNGKTAQERQSSRREQLIRAGLQLYGERGYRNATVKAVCDVAGLTERYFYESFANSEELLCACFGLVTDEILAAMRRAAHNHGGPPIAQVRAGLLIYLKSLRANPAATRVFLFEMASVSPQTEALVSQSHDAYGRLLVEVLSRDPGFDPAVPRLLLRGVIGGGLHVAQAWIAGGYAEDIDAVADIALGLYALTAPARRPGRTGDAATPLFG